MQEALYGDDGYYMTERLRFGRSGDFYTSAQVSPLFGALWALAAWRDVASKDVVRIVELGCGEGMLAEAMMRGLCEKAALKGRSLRYAGIDLSLASRERTRLRLQAVKDECDAAGVDFQFTLVSSVAELAPSGSAQWHGAWVFGNEVLDALPCEVIRVGEREVSQLFVATKPALLASGHSEGPFHSSQLTTYFAPCKAVWAKQALHVFEPLRKELSVQSLVTEWTPDLRTFLTEVCERLRPQVLTFIDYGGYAQDVVGPDRPHGSVRAYQHHQLVADFMDLTGACDITYDVNFTIVHEELIGLGYACDPLRRQGAWLLSLPDVQALLETFEAAAPGSVRRALSLFMPGGMGDRFVVCRAYPDRQMEA